MSEFDWVKLEKYLEDSGDTRDAVNGRKRSGEWQEGVHWQKRGGRIWINKEAHRKWIEFGNKKSHAA